MGYCGSDIMKHYPQIYNLAYKLTKTREDAEDLAQDSAIRIFKYSNSKYSEKQQSNWIKRVVLSVWINKERHDKVRETENHDYLDDPDKQFVERVPVVREIENQMQSEENIGRLKLLSESDQRLIHLRSLGFSYKRISQQLGITENCVKIKIFRLKKRIKKLYV